MTVSKDGSARLWSAASGSPLAMLKGQGESLQDAIFAPDGGRLLTIGTEGWIRIWKPSEIGALKGGDLAQLDVRRQVDENIHPTFIFFRARSGQTTRS